MFVKELSGVGFMEGRKKAQVTRGLSGKENQGKSLNIRELAPNQKHIRTAFVNRVLKETLMDVCALGRQAVAKADGATVDAYATSLITADSP